MSDFDGIPKTKVIVEMAPTHSIYGAYTPPTCEFPVPPSLPSTIIISATPQMSSTIGALAEADAIAEKFVKRTKAINMEYHDNKPKSLSYYWYTFGYWVGDHNPFTEYVHASSVEEYLSLPAHRRTLWAMWYKDVIISGGGRHILGSKAEREQIVHILKERYPIQYPLRQWGFFLGCRFRSYWDNLCYFLKPRQKWLKKQIPNEWCDKTHLIPLINFAVVVDFVEGEDAINVTDWEASSEQASQFEKELKDCYDYIKVRRPKLEEEHGNSYPDEETMTGDYHVDYAENNRLEIELDKNDTKYLTWIVVNRDFFWT